MTGLVVVAASGLATEVLALEQARGRYSSFVVVDDDERRWGSDVAGVEVVGGLVEVKAYPDHQLVVCVGNGLVRRTLVRRLRSHGIDDGRFARVVHPSVDVPTGCAIGVGSVVLAQVAITAQVEVGRHVVVMPNVTLTHHGRVDDYVTLCAGVSLGGGVRLGTGAYLGMNSTVREQLSIGAEATLGMGSVLLCDVPAQETWFGVPARPASPRPVPGV